MNILAFFAHPDDETMLGGGLFALLSKAGQKVHYLCCTRGEGGECGDPPICSQEQLGQVREKELACAVKELGGISLDFLNYVDPLVGKENALFSFTKDHKKLSLELAEYLKKYEIDVLITHGSNGEYGHPGHLTVYQVAKDTIEREFSALNWYTTQAFYEESSKPHLLNKHDAADWVIDTTAVLEEKIKAAMCHKSQNALFVRRKSKESGKPVRVADVIQIEESYFFANGNSDVLKNIPVVKENIIFDRKQKNEV